MFLLLLLTCDDDVSNERETKKSYCVRVTQTQTDVLFLSIHYNHVLWMMIYRL